MNLLTSDIFHTHLSVNLLLLTFRGMFKDVTKAVAPQTFIFSETLERQDLYRFIIPVYINFIVFAIGLFSKYTFIVIFLLFLDTVGLTFGR